MKKHIIWTDESEEDRVDVVREMVECGVLDEGQEPTDEEVYQFLAEENGRWLDDERSNLDVRLPSNIVAIADIGRWNGRIQGYKIVGNNIQDCLYSECESCTWYVDGRGNMRADMTHHDGVNHVLYRMLRSTLSDNQESAFLHKVYMGQATDKDVSRCTVRIGDCVGDVYGWTFAGRRPKIVVDK